MVSNDFFFEINLRMSTCFSSCLVVLVLLLFLLYGSLVFCTRAVPPILQTTRSSKYRRQGRLCHPATASWELVFFKMGTQKLLIQWHSKCLSVEEINQLQWESLERDTELVSCESWRHDIAATIGTRVCRHSPFWGDRFKMPLIFARPIRNGGSNLHSEPKPFEGSQNVKISTIYRSWQSCETMSESCVACIFLSTMIGFCHMQTHHSWEESTFSSQRWSGQGLQVFLLVCG